MKKTLLTIALFAFAASTFAQDDPVVGQNNQIRSKNGHKILPEAGQWGIVIEADPFFSYLGNAFNGNSNNNAPSFNFTTNNYMITGKCVKDSIRTRRVGIRLGMHNATNEYETPLDSADGSSFTVPQYGNDEQKISSTSIILSAGTERHRGVSRINGYYGWEGMIGFGSSGKTTNTYANTMTIDPDSTTGGNNGNYSPTYSPTGPSDFGSGTYGQINEVKRGSSFMLAIRGFIGADYYVAPNVAIGGEFGWSIGIHSLGATEETSQHYDVTTNTIITETHENPGKNSNFDFDTDNGWSSSWFSQTAGSLHIAVYF